MEQDPTQKLRTVLDHPLASALSTQRRSTKKKRNVSFRMSSGSAHESEGDDEIRRIPTDEDVDDDGMIFEEEIKEPPMTQEEMKQEVIMDFGVTEAANTSFNIPQSKNMNSYNDDDDGEPIVEQTQDHDPETNMLDISIKHMAKKNLCFELEYIQTVCQSLDIRVSTQFGQFNKRLYENEDNPLMALSESLDSKMVHFSDDGDEEPKKPVKFNKTQEKNDKEQTKMRLYLESMYQKLNQMKKDCLKDEVNQSREDLKKQLVIMACHLERTRLYLDSYIYPRDHQLNLIDVTIEENSTTEKKKAMHLTERLYTIAYKDFFTAYERAVLLHQKITKMTGKDIEDYQSSNQIANPVSEVLNSELLEDDRESIMMASQDIENNKLGKEAEDAKKHISKKQGGVNQDMRSMIKMLNSFYPNLPTFSSVEEIVDMELTFVVKLKSVLLSNHEVYMTLYQENGQPFSLTANYDQEQKAANQYQEHSFFFVNIPLKTILMNNLALIIKFVEKRRSRGPSSSANLLNTQEANSWHKTYKGYTILPISKLFWVQQLRVKQIYEIKEAQIYKPMNPLHIEDRYVTLIEKRGFKKYKDQLLSQYFGVCYQYKLEPKLKEDQMQNKNSTIVRRIDFIQQMLYSKDQDQSNYLKQKVDKYRFNDLKIDLNNLYLSESTSKKSPVIRVEMALRDNYGVVYDTIYKTISDNSFHFMQTYESLIYPSELEIKMIENFFVRIPTKSLDTLKKIYLVFLVQTLVYQKDAKGNKIKSTNFTNDIDQLQFKTELVAAMPLYDFVENCILKNKTYTLDLFQIEDLKKPIPTKFEYFKPIQNMSNLKASPGDRLTFSLKLISNEFTHNPYINNLLLLKDTLSHESQDVETILRSLKNLKDSNEQVLFHDKIFDKLFQLMSQTRDEEVADLIFETIIMMIDCFQIRFADYKEILENYISKHFAHSKVYINLLKQIRKVARRIHEGIKENAENEEKNVYVLKSMKYLGIILKIVRNSFLEAQSCQDSLPDSQDGPNIHGNDMDFYQKQKYGLFKQSIIDEANEEESDEEDESFIKKGENMDKQRKGAMRSTVTREESKISDQHRDLTKAQFGVSIQESLKYIFEGCHINAMKTTLSLRAILYEVIIYFQQIQNITSIFENITDFMDDKFLQSVLSLMYNEQQHLLGHGGKSKSKDNNKTSKSKLSSDKNSTTPKVHGVLKNPQVINDDPVQPPNKRNETTGGILKTPQVISNEEFKQQQPMKRNDMQSVGGQFILFDENYLGQEQNVKALQEWNWINEEAITKLKIIAMGKILAHGILEKVQGDTNKIVVAFCQNIERHHLKRTELNYHVFYFLYQLFQYMKSPDEFQEIDEIKNQKLKIFSKSNLDLKDFFTSILPEIANYLRLILKDQNIEDRLKDAKFPDEILKPIKEKASLVLLSVANSVSKEKLKQFIFSEPKKLLSVVKTLKNLSSKISFQEPYAIFFEKKKIQVMRKIIEYLISLFMDLAPQDVGSEYHPTINQCRLMMVYLWNKLAKIKKDYKQTMRSKTMVKDQLKVHKGKMLDTFRAFWKKFMYLGQPWISIKGSMSKQFMTFIKLSNDKAIKLYMDVISDTMTFEYKETQDIFNTSTSIFKVFYELNNSIGKDCKDDIAKRFYEAFEKTMTDHNQLFQNDIEFQKLVRQRFQQMKGLSDAIINVNYSKENMKENTFYRAYCQAQLIEILWELKLFQLFLENQGSYESLNSKLENNLEIAYTQLRFVESLEDQTEDDRVQIGQREIVAHITLNSLRKVCQFFRKAEFYEKAIEILNKQKDIAENQIYDFNAVSQIVKEQYKIYKTLSQEVDRHFAKYFKIGFFGQSFPNMFRNKEFIFRGSKLMRRPDVKDRIIKYFPDALCLEYSQYPEKAVLQGDKKGFQVQPIEPLTYMELKDFEMAQTTKDQEELDYGKKAKDLPPKLRAYYLENFKNKFYKQTLLDNKAGDDLLRDRQIEIFTVKNKFPTIFNMQEIIKTKKFIRLAMDEAIRNVQVIIDTIDTLRKTATHSEDPSDFEFLSSQIRAALESPIQGGIEKYFFKFITETNLRGPQREKCIELFKKIEECDRVISEGIQSINSFVQDETMSTKINGDYKSFKENQNKFRTMIYE